MNEQSSLETEHTPEQPSQAVEKALEIKQEQLDQGADILENPKDGSFMLGLQTFIAWVKTLLAKHD